MAVRERLQSQLSLTVILGLAEFARGALTVSLLAHFVTGPLKAPITVVGWALSSHYFLDTVFRSPAGWLVDRLGPSTVLSVGLALEVVALVGVMHTRHWPWVILWVSVLGIGTASHWPSVVTGTNRLSRRGTRAQSMSVIFAAWLLGSGLGPIVINFFLRGFDQTAFAILIGGDALALALTLLVTHPELNPKPVDEPHRWWQSLGLLWPYRTILPGMMIQNMTLGILLPVLEPYVSRVLHLSHGQFAELLAGGGFITVALLWPMGRFTDRLGIRFPLIGGLFMAAGALVGIMVTRHFWALVGLGGVLGLSYAMILPAWNAFLGRMIPAAVEGSLWGLFMTVEGFGMALGPIIGTRLFEWGAWAPFAFSAAVLGMMGIFYWAYPLMPAQRT